VVTNSKFKFIAGALCLDFVNTVGGRVASGIVRDKLAEYRDLVQWAEAAGVLSRAGTPDADDGGRSDVAAARPALARAVAFREALYRIAIACVEGRGPAAADVALLNRETAIAKAHECLHFSRGRFLVEWDDPDAPDRILWTVARSAAGFLASPALASLRQCGGEECGWLFLDTSRNHSRQWCDMRICGNRAKLRRFRERRRRG
jgi:predicted RNA-binding Zn ribbon-like protein